MKSVEDMDFISEYLEWIRKNTTQYKINEYVEITTPFLDIHNDHIQFYVRKTPDGFELTDDGYILSDLQMSGCDIKSPKRQEMVSQIAATLGVTIKQEEICTHATRFDIAQKQHIMIQAMLKIGDMFMTSSSRVKGLFCDEVCDFLFENDVRCTRSIMIMGHSGLSHCFDFVIPSSRKSPERVITALNSPTKQSVQAALFSWNDVQKTRPERSKGYIVLNDAKKAVGQELLSAIDSYDLTPIPWKLRTNYVEELAS